MKRSAPLLPLLPLLLLLALPACGPDATADQDPSDADASRSETRPSTERSADDSDGSAPSTSGSSDAESKVRVEVVVVEPTLLEEAVWTTGQLRADESVELRPEEDGRLVALHFREGERVEKGALLAEINDEDLVADLRRAEVRLELAEQRRDRVEALLDEKTVSQEVFDEAAGEVEMLEAEIELIEARVRQMRIHAPFSGVIGLRSVSEGSYVTSQTVIATLQRLDPIKLDFATPEKYAAVVGEGDRVEFTVAGSTGTHSGLVYAREPRIDPETRTVRLRARAPNPGGRLLPGAFAKVRLVLERAEKTLLVPSIALVPGVRETTVWVVEDGRAVARVVETGQRTDERVEIVSGLEPGDRVIVSGVQMVRPGQAVEVAP